MTISKITMSPTQWARVQDNPIQRDTEAHARRALKTHLSQPSVAHWVCHAAILPDRTMVKLDGHTRAYLWRTGQLFAPEQVTVMVYPVATMDEAEALYSTFDSPSATETAPDRLSGAYRRANIAPTSSLLNVGGVTMALKFMFYGARSPALGFIYSAVEDYRAELMLLDSLQLSSPQLPGGWLAGALITLRVRGNAAMPFWRAFAGNSGVSVDGVSDGVHMLTNTIRIAKASGTVTGTYSRKWRQAALTISCVESWGDGVHFKKTPIERAPEPARATDPAHPSLQPEVTKTPNRRGRANGEPLSNSTFTR
jgi:hypothetical protein